MLERCRLSSFGHNINFFFYEAINIALEASNRDSATSRNFKLEYVGLKYHCLPLFSFTSVAHIPQCNIIRSLRTF